MSSSGSYVVIHLMSSMIYYSYVPFRRRRTGIVARASHLSGTRVPLDWHARPVPGAAHTAKRPPDWMSGGRCVVLWWLALGQRSPVAQCGPQGTAQHMPPLIPQADNAGVWPEWHGPHQTAICAGSNGPLALRCASAAAIAAALRCAASAALSDRDCLGGMGDSAP